MWRSTETRGRLGFEMHGVAVDGEGRTAGQILQRSQDLPISAKVRRRLARGAPRLMQAREGRQFLAAVGPIAQRPVGQ